MFTAIETKSLSTVSANGDGGLGLMFVTLQESVLLNVNLRVYARKRYTKPDKRKQRIRQPVKPSEIPHSLLFVQAISAATERVWIASPYFVPDEAVLKALELADLRRRLEDVKPTR